MLRGKASFFRSRVARRVFVQFILCSLVPIAALGIISFDQVTKQLHDQGQIRLLHYSKNLGMSIFERLSFLEATLQNLSRMLPPDPEALSRSLSGDYQNRLKQEFKGIAVFLGPKRHWAFFGDIPGLNFSKQERLHLHSGKSILISHHDPQGRLHIYMARFLSPGKSEEGFIVGAVNVRYLLGISDYDTLPHRTELCLLDQMENVIYCSIPVPSGAYRKKVANASSGYFEWKSGHNKLLASFWSIPLKYYFLHSRWTVIMSQPENYIFSPVAYFKKTFPLVIILSLFVVIFISLVQIRRTMLPLQELKEGARRIGMKQFDERISVESKDEFEDLARTFNGMAEELGRQFYTMTAAAEIDRAILSSLKTEEIAKIVLTRITDLFHCTTAGLILLDIKGEKPPKAYRGSNGTDEVRLVDTVELPPAEMEQFLKKRDFITIETSKITPNFLAPFVTNNVRSFTTFPFFVQEEFAGIIVLGPSDPFEQEKDNLSRARLLTNQVAVALSNARLLEELTDLNWGTLKALARAVDAKSPWTSGHSERVTAIALMIGRTLKLSPVELDDLHRGSLIHDIGKIGVPARILDKSEKLTPEEQRIIREHPRMGARIIEPIAPYRRILPILLQHHERLDGKGYPNRLTGNDIAFVARIVSVADAYDAMVSDRPYRKGIESQRAIGIIKNEAGRQFDPLVVNAFLEVLGETWEEDGFSSLGRVTHAGSI